MNLRSYRARRAGLATAMLAALAAIVPLTSATAARTLLSQGMPVLASSIEGGATPAEAAVDGAAGTRWASQFSDPQWIHVDLGSTAAISRVMLQVDLGAVTTVNHVELGSEAAYARPYQIQVPTDGSPWSTAYTTAAGDGGFDEIDLNVSARYVRMNGAERGTTYGYSLWEFGVYTP